jgi:thioredoxin reductase (NADPH)
VVSGLRLRDGRTDEEFELDVEGLFIFVGLEPNTALLAPLVELDEHGCVPTTSWMETSVPGLFAAGDIRSDSPGQQLVNVASDGATAAIAAHRYVEERRHFS